MSNETVAQYINNRAEVKTVIVKSKSSWIWVESKSYEGWDQVLKSKWMRKWVRMDTENHQILFEAKSNYQ